MVSCRKIEYPGVVQLIERAVWDREARGFEPHHSDQMTDPTYSEQTVTFRIGGVISFWNPCYNMRFIAFLHW